MDPGSHAPVERSAWRYGDGNLSVGYQHTGERGHGTRRGQPPVDVGTSDAHEARVSAAGELAGAVFEEDVARVPDGKRSERPMLAKTRLGRHEDAASVSDNSARARPQRVLRSTQPRRLHRAGVAPPLERLQRTAIPKPAVEAPHPCGSVSSTNEAT